MRPGSGLHEGMPARDNAARYRGVAVGSGEPRIARRGMTTMVRTRATFPAMIMILSTAAAAHAGPEALTSAEGRFSAVFPDRVKTAQQAVPTPVGNLTAHVFTAEFPRQSG